MKFKGLPIANCLDPTVEGGDIHLEFVAKCVKVFSGRCVSLGWLGDEFCNIPAW